MAENQILFEELALIRLTGQAVELNSVPAEVLIRSLSGMQQLVYIAASDSENRKLFQRFRVTAEIERQYKLMCKVSQPGSYVMPLELAGDDQQLTILPGSYVQIFEKVGKFLARLGGDQQSPTDVFENDSFAKKALIEARKFLPKADDSWSFGFKIPGQSEITLNKNAVKRIDKMLLTDSPAESVETFTGELIAINFDDKKVLLRYPPTRQIIECIYADDLEDAMIENRRQYVQVTGEFNVGSDGNPVKLVNVTRIEALDLSPLILSEVSYGNRRFLLKKTLHLVPKLEEEGKQLLVIEEPNLGLNVFARTRESLEDEIAEQIAFLWEEYALAASDTLTPEAQKLKSLLLASVEEQNAA